MRPRPGQKLPQLEIAVLTRAKAWDLPGVASLCRRAARAAVAAAFEKRTGAWGKSLRRRGGEIGILLAGDAYVAKLNAAYRGRAGPTNVLSFPGELSGGPASAPLALGDIVVAYGTAAREAKRAGTPLKHHLAHLIVHGVLHLLGYDHERESDARRMESLEAAVLATLGIPDPYREASAEVA